MNSQIFKGPADRLNTSLHLRNFYLRKPAPHISGSFGQQVRHLEKRCRSIFRKYFLLAAYVALGLTASCGLAAFAEISSLSMSVLEVSP